MHEILHIRSLMIYDSICFELCVFYSQTLGRGWKTHNEVFRVLKRGKSNVRWIVHMSIHHGQIARKLFHD